MPLPFPLARDGQEVGDIERVNDGLPHVLAGVPRERANERFETVIGFDMRDVPGCLDGALDERGPRFDLFRALAADEQHRGVVSVEHGSCVEVTEGRIELVGAFKRMLIEAARGPKHLRGEGAGPLLPATLLFFEKGFALLIVLHNEALAPADLEGERPEGTEDPRERVRGIAAKRDRRAPSAFRGSAGRPGASPRRARHRGRREPRGAASVASAPSDNDRAPEGAHRSRVRSRKREI